MKTKQLELYLHIPFCIKKCHYCDFVSFPCGEATRDAYVRQLAKEISSFGELCREYQVVSIFIGGGTPSVLTGNQITFLMEEVYKYFSVDPLAENTIEINPGTISREKLMEYRNVGINRLSFGLQSIHENELKILGRIHDYSDFLKGYDQARAIGLSNINIDLMSGIPRQTVDSWKKTLETVSLLEPEHISAYSLILEEGTNFFENPKIASMLPTEEEVISMYKISKTILKEKGFDQYEISNYAKPGYECIHNCGYWTGTDYLGLGLNASSCFQEHRFKNTENLNDYMMQNSFLEKYENSNKQTLEAQMEEFMFLGLRMTKGVSISKFENRFHQSMESVYHQTIVQLARKGLIKINHDQLSIPEKYSLISNQIFSEFLLDI